MQIQEPSPPDPDQLHPSCEDKKVNMIEWTPNQDVATPSRWLPRSFSARADPPSPFSSNPAHEPVSTPTTPSAAPFGCVTATPPATPKDKPPPPVMSAAAFAAFWANAHPRRLMQRAARAFRSSRSRRRIKFDEPAVPLAPAAGSRLSDAASGGGSMDAEHGSSDGNISSSCAASVDADDNNKKTVVQHEEEQQQNGDEIVPAEKIIHVANHHHHQAEPVSENPPADDDQEKEHEEEKEEEPKKAGALVEDTAADVVADKFCMVVKEAMTKKKHEEEEKEADKDDTRKDAMSRFQGSRVKTAMEARAESEQPRRREVARSNDVIEEACTKLLAKRQGSRVRALVGAFETVMDAKPADTPRHRYRQASV